MEKDQKKRLIIVGVYVFIALLFVYMLYAWLKVEPSCFDAVKNQNEAGVDCGGICAMQCAKLPQQNLSVEEVNFVPSGIAGKIDIYGKIYNPNQAFGVEKFNYEFKIKNSSGEVVSIKPGSGYILPGERKYIIESNLDASMNSEKVEMEISEIEWVEAGELYEKPQLKIVNKNYREIENGIGFSESIGLLKNESPFDFNGIKIVVILKDENEKVIAMNSTQMNTVKSGENREFKVFWPGEFFGNVSNMDIQAEVNVFDSESFMRRYFQSEKFQQYQ